MCGVAGELAECVVKAGDVDVVVAAGFDGWYRGRVEGVMKVQRRVPQSGVQRQIEIVSADVDPDIPATCPLRSETGCSRSAARVEHSATGFAAGDHTFLGQLWWHDGEMGMGEGHGVDRPDIAGVSAAGMVHLVQAHRFPLPDTHIRFAFTSSAARRRSVGGRPFDAGVRVRFSDGVQIKPVAGRFREQEHEFVSGRGPVGDALGFGVGLVPDDVASEDFSGGNEAVL